MKWVGTEVMGEHRSRCGMIRMRVGEGKRQGGVGSAEITSVGE